MTERMLEFNGVSMCTDSFGNRSDPPVLLIMGATASMLGWPDGFCERLAAAGRFVIRYDNRDTGRSTTYSPGSANYSLQDMAEDAVGVLDAYELKAAHIVGMSLGGMIAQIIALQHPDRVLSVAAVASSPVEKEHLDLPGIDDKFSDFFWTATTLDWTDEDAVVEFMLGRGRLMVGSGHAFNEARARETAVRDFRRAINYQSQMNHTLVETGDWRDRVRQIAKPFLVIHGTEDPILPLAHGVALAQRVNGASLVTLDGTGHELHESDWDDIIGALVGHTAPA